MADKPFYFDADDKGCPNTADIVTSQCSDIDDFEKLSIPCSEPTSGDELDLDTTGGDYITKRADNKWSSKMTQCNEVQKPPTVSHASVHMGVHQQSPLSGRTERSALSSDLVLFAQNVDEYMAAEIQSEVEKQLRVERAEMKRQKADYERVISDLRAERSQSSAEAEKPYSRGSFEHQHQQQEYLLLKDTCRLLHEDNDSLSHRCAKLEQQMVMLEQQAAESNRQMKACEDELHGLRAKFSADRVPQQHRPTYEIVKNDSSVCQMKPLQKPRSSKTRSQNVWTCHRCTFDNQSSANRCEVCDTPRTSERTLDC